MNILIIGAGGREHALAWKAARSPLTERVFVAPGNAGTALEPGVENLPIDARDADALVRFAAAHAVGLTIVGPEAPLVAGIADAFAAAGLPCFGPSQAAAQLEGSKTFAKAFMARHGIPTAPWRSFTDRTEALAYIDATPAPLVVKADGLAAGKGVLLAPDTASAKAAVETILGEGRFGAAGQRIIIEECLSGEEVSFIAMLDGEHILPLASSQDHKARDEGDRGPNTGGMGAYSPAPVVTPALHERIMDEVMHPTLAGLRQDGIAYVGFLYAGLMISPDGTPRVLEYNCRLGDPETQPILMRLDSDLVQLCLDALAGQLCADAATWHPEPALGVVIAAGGYPDVYRTGDVISGLDAPPGRDPGSEHAKLFHAGTRREGDQVVTNGGRVLCATALGSDLRTAAERAYALVDSIGFAGAYCRRDIGHRALAAQD
ncbi:MAG: phosphoribosylamine--glycine ligase [Chromatiaceae bacterium]|nr:MAG: phosphoribosylamine--glycine ligase [Chromatiaceae bacterium]